MKKTPKGLNTNPPRSDSQVYESSLTTLPVYGLTMVCGQAGGIQLDDADDGLGLKLLAEGIDPQVE